MNKKQPRFPNDKKEISRKKVVANTVLSRNDYLEYLSELGVGGMALFLGGLISLIISSFLIWRVRRHPEVKGLALGGIVAVVAILIHSLTDFNLHIPANVFLLSVMLSLIVVTVHYKRRSSSYNPII